MSGGPWGRDAYAQEMQEMYLQNGQPIQVGASYKLPMNQSAQMIDNGADPMDAQTVKFGAPKYEEGRYTVVNGSAVRITNDKLQAHPPGYVPPDPNAQPDINITDKPLVAGSPGGGMMPPQPPTPSPLQSRTTPQLGNRAVQPDAFARNPLQRQMTEEERRRQELLNLYASRGY